MHVFFGVLIYEERISLHQKNPVRFRKGFEIWKKKNLLAECGLPILRLIHMRRSPARYMELFQWRLHIRSAKQTNPFNMLRKYPQYFVLQSS